MLRQTRRFGCLRHYSWVLFEWLSSESEYWSKMQKSATNHESNNLLFRYNTSNKKMQMSWWFSFSSLQKPVIFSTERAVSGLQKLAAAALCVWFIHQFTLLHYFIESQPTALISIKLTDNARSLVGFRRFKAHLLTSYHRECLSGRFQQLEICLHQVPILTRCTS